MSCNILGRSDGWLLYRADRLRGNCKIEKIRTQNLFCLRIGKDRNYSAALAEFLGPAHRTTMFQ
jgi:hypothetical protein